jgi:hypothetical protein
MEYTEADLPVEVKENEYLKLNDGTTVRFEESGGARDVMIGEEWTPRTTLFPGNEYMLDSGGKSFRLTATDYSLKVEAV